MAKFEAINDWVIVKKPQERMTETGIILTHQKEGVVFEMEVVATTETTKQLQGKTVYCQPRHCTELANAEDGYYGAIQYQNIVAIKHD